MMSKLNPLLPVFAILAFALPTSEAMADPVHPNIIRIGAPVSLSGKNPAPTTPISYALSGTLRGDGISFQSDAAPSIILENASSEERHASFLLSADMPIFFEKLVAYDPTGGGADYHATIEQQGCTGSGNHYQCFLNVGVTESGGVGCENIFSGCGSGSVGQIDFEGRVQKYP
ncbi:hypothetical protein [Pseudomonas amygdali]|uniref:hypothetical protein n=2 Tax=Pseudomonas amygdali TaxID=47877 RepID=UPI0011C3AA00|nr:hypothetical protein [Pseudomonas amygdali]